MSYTNEVVYLARIKPGPYQHREDFSGIGDLALSIKAEGLINPPLVTRQGQEYLLLAGERRWRSLVVNGLVEQGAMTWDKAVDTAQGDASVRPVLVELAQTHLAEMQAEVRVAHNGHNAKVLAVVENGQRQDLNPLEEGRDYHSLVDDGHTPADVAEIVNKAVSTVKARILLLELEPELQEWVVQKKLPKTLDVIQALLELDSQVRIGLARRAVEQPGFTKTNLLNACKTYARVQNRKSHSHPLPSGNGATTPQIELLPQGVSIKSVQPAIVYHKKPKLPVCSTCADVVHQLLEECCGSCAANGVTQKCLSCEGFLEFANRLIVSVNSTVIANLLEELGLNGTDMHE